MVDRVSATADALAMIEKLKAGHGALLFISPAAAVMAQPRCAIRALSSRSAPRMSIWGSKSAASRSIWAAPSSNTGSTRI